MLLSTTRVPSSGVTSPDIILISVDLPQPFCPNQHLEVAVLHRNFYVC